MEHSSSHPPEKSRIAPVPEPMPPFAPTPKQTPLAEPSTERNPREQSTPSEQKTERNPIGTRTKAIYGGVAAIVLLGGGMGTGLFANMVGGQDKQENEQEIAQDRDGNENDQQNRAKSAEGQSFFLPALPEIEKIVTGEKGNAELHTLLERAKTEKLSERDISRLRTLRDAAIRQLRDDYNARIQLVRDELEKSIRINRSQMDSRITETTRITEEAVNESRSRNKPTR